MKKSDGVVHIGLTFNVEAADSARKNSLSPNYHKILNFARNSFHRLQKTEHIGQEEIWRKKSK